MLLRHVFCSKHHHRVAEEGFTLLEIILVINIIGILAAISVPILQDVKVQAYNSLAHLSVKEIAKQEELFYLDHDEYGTSNNKQTKRGKKKGKAIYGPTGGYIVTSNNSRKNSEQAYLPLSDGIGVVVAADKSFKSYVITVKHLAGDRRYCYDSENGIIYSDKRYKAGTKLTRSKSISSKLGRDDCARIRTMSPV